jgi:hypothetical protein
VTLYQGITQSREVEAMSPGDVARVTKAVRRALNLVETGQGTLADVEPALAGVGAADPAP